MTAYFASAVVTSQLAAITSALGTNSHLKIYTDAQSNGGKDPDTAFSGTLLADFTITSWTTAAESGSFPNKTVVATANFSAGTVPVTTGGTASTFALTTSAGTVILTGAVGTSGAELNFGSTTFSAGANCTITSFTLTMPE